MARPQREVAAHCMWRCHTAVRERRWPVERGVARAICRPSSLVTIRPDGDDATADPRGRTGSTADDITLLSTAALRSDGTAGGEEQSCALGTTVQPTAQPQCHRFSAMRCVPKFGA